MEGTFTVIALWALLFAACLKWELAPLLSCKGIALTGHDCYRFVTGLFVHRSFFHLLANAAALFFIGHFLEKQLGSAKFLLLALSAAMISQLIFACIYRNSTFFGGSPIIFAAIGLILSIQLFAPDAARFRLGTWYGNWTLAYAILANVPLFSKDISTLVIHLLSLAVGFVLGWAGLLLKLF